MISRLSLTAPLEPSSSRWAFATKFTCKQPAKPSAAHYRIRRLIADKHPPPPPPAPPLFLVTAEPPRWIYPKLLCIMTSVDPAPCCSPPSLQGLRALPGRSQVKAHSQVPQLWGDLSIELNEDVLTRNGRNDFCQDGAAKLVQWVVDRQRGALTTPPLLLLLLPRPLLLLLRLLPTTDGCWLPGPSHGDCRPNAAHDFTGNTLAFTIDQQGELPAQRR